MKKTEIAHKIEKLFRESNPLAEITDTRIYFRNFTVVVA